MTKGIELILLHSTLSTVDRLYIPTVIKDVITKNIIIKSTKNQIKQINNEYK